MKRVLSGISIALVLLLLRPEAQDIVTKAVELMTAIGVLFTQLGAQSPTSLGMLMCCTMPLASLGSWVLGHLGELLAALDLKNTLRSLFRD